MNVRKRLKELFAAGYFIWVGIGIGVLYWLLESLLHIFFFGGVDFGRELTNPDPHEIWKRILVVCLLVTFGVFAQQHFSFRKRSESALKESESKYRTIFEEAMNPIFLFDQTGRFIDNNRALLDFFECTREDLDKITFRDTSAGKHLTGFSEKASSLSERDMLEIEYPTNRTIKTMLLNLVPFQSGLNNFIYGIGQDISQRKKMEQMTKQAHAELDQIFQTASVGMRVVDKDFNVMKINKTFADMVGLSVGEAVGKKCYEIFSGTVCHTPNCPIARIQSGDSLVEAYVDKKRKDGKIIHTILNATPFNGADEEMIGIVESFRDITQLKVAQEIIHSERDKLNRILENLVEGVCIINTNYTIEYQNDVFGKDAEHSTDRKCYSVFRGRTEPCTPCLMQKAVDLGSVQIIEYDTDAGQSYEQAYTKFVDIDGETKVITLVRDITEKKTSLAAAMHAERLTAIGELAAGVAHEINNPINGIINYAQIILNKSQEHNETADIARRMIKEGNRIARIVEGLLTFARRDHKTKSPVSVKQIFEEAMTLTAAQLRKDHIILKTDLRENLPHIIAQPNEIEQVIVNIISNARHALNEKYPGNNDNKILEVSTDLVKSRGRFNIMICFKDYGTGIPEDVIEKVLNPFFTTKSEGKRTGLGLSISHCIIQEHKGKLSFESKQGQYTKVILELPCHLN